MKKSTFNSKTGEFILGEGINDIENALPDNPKSTIKTLDLRNFKGKKLPEYWFCNSRSLEKVILSNSIKEIGIYCFGACINLKEINFNGVESIGGEAFSYCENLEKITLSGTKSIGQQAFRLCGNLKEINLDGVESIGEEAFSCCSALKKISNASSVKIIGDKAFYMCLSLRGDLNFTQNNVEIHESSFEECEMLSNIHLKKNAVFQGNRIFYNSSRLPHDIFGEIDAKSEADREFLNSVMPAFEKSNLESYFKSLFEPDEIEEVKFDGQWGRTYEPLFPAGRPQPGDVNQGGVGNCVLLSVLQGLAAADPQSIIDCMRDDPENGKVYVTLFDTPAKYFGISKPLAKVNKKVTVTVDRSVLCRADGKAPKNYEESGLRDCHALWVRVMEKAVATYWSKVSPEKLPKIDGKTVETANQSILLSLITGKTTKLYVVSADNQEDNAADKVYSKIAEKIRRGQTVTCNLKTSLAPCLPDEHRYAIWGALTANKNGVDSAVLLPNTHDLYTKNVIPLLNKFKSDLKNEYRQFFILRNPWGYATDGAAVLSSGAERPRIVTLENNDGVCLIEVQSFIEYGSTFSRTSNK